MSILHGVLFIGLIVFMAAVAHSVLFLGVLYQARKTLKAGEFVYYYDTNGVKQMAIVIDISDLKTHAKVKVNNEYTWVTIKSLYPTSVELEVKRRLDKWK